MAGVTQAQVDGLGARFDKGFDEIKSLMRSFDERIRSIELREASCSPLLIARIAAIEKQVTNQQEEIEKMRLMVEKQLDAANKITSAIQTINSWGKWGARVATALIISGLVFFIGRLIYLAVMP
jgi:hypothetical protein